MEIWSRDNSPKKPKRRTNLGKVSLAILAGLGIGALWEMNKDDHKGNQSATIAGPAVAGDKNVQKREIIAPNPREVLATLRTQRGNWADELVALKKRQHDLGWRIIQNHNDSRAMLEIELSEKGPGVKFESASEENQFLYRRINDLTADIKKIDEEIRELEQTLGANLAKK